MSLSHPIIFPLSLLLESSQVPVIHELEDIETTNSTRARPPTRAHALTLQGIVQFLAHRGSQCLFVG